MSRYPKNSPSDEAEPSITVVVPTFNREQLLRQTLASLEMQTVADAEFLIVDNASEDGTPDVVAEFCDRDPRFRAIRNSENVGFQRNIYTGLNEARSDCVVFLADDDIMLPETLEQYLMGFADPSVGLVLCNALQIDPTGIHVTYVLQRFKRDEKLRGEEALTKVWPEVTFISGLAVRKSAGSRAWRPELVYPQLDLAAHILVTSAAFVLAHYGIGARVHAGQMGNSVLEAQERDSVSHVFEELPRILRDVYGDDDAQLIVRVCDFYMRRTYRSLIVNRRLEAGRRGAWRTFRLGLGTYRGLRKDWLLLGGTATSMLLPQWLVLRSKELVRRIHLKRHASVVAAYSMHMSRLGLTPATP